VGVGIELSAIVALLGVATRLGGMEWFGAGLGDGRQHKV
jgi:hypothetical protein